MFEIPSSASSSSDGGEDLLSFEILEEASLDAQSAANTCPCGGHPVVVAVVGLIASGCMVKFATGIVAVLDRCQCRESRSLLTGAPDAIVQLGVQLGETWGERGQLLHMQRVAVMRDHAREDHTQPFDVPSSALSSQPVGVIFPPDAPSS